MLSTCYVIYCIGEGQQERIEGFLYCRSHEWSELVATGRSEHVIMSFSFLDDSRGPTCLLTCVLFPQVVDLLLARGANKEHRNVSDYTPLSLAASGGYVNIIKILLNAGAEINSR